MAFMVSIVASATPRLPESVAALENWFFRISCAARRVARCALLLRGGGRVALRALAASLVKLASVLEIQTGCYLRLDCICGGSGFLWSQHQGGKEKKGIPGCLPQDRASNVCRLGEQVGNHREQLLHAGFRDADCRLAPGCSQV